MRRMLGGPFEALQVLGMAVYFAVAGALTLFSAPTWFAKLTSMSPETAARHFNEVASLIGRHGSWLAGAALVGGIVAPYARGDGEKGVAWLRILCAAATVVLVVVAWGGTDGPRLIAGDVENGAGAADALRWRSDKSLTPWNGLLLATGLNLVLGAFQISGGGKKPKAAEPAKK